MKTKLLKICLTFFTIFGFSNNTYAYNWFLLVESNGVEFYWDQEISLETNHSGNYIVWNMMTFAPGSLAEKIQIKDSSPQRTNIYNQEIDCNLNRYRTVYIETYDAYMGKGNLISKSDFELLETHKRNEWKYSSKMEDIRDQAVMGFCKELKPNKK